MAMADLIEDYALIGDTETAALVSRNGSIDWLCVPRFDSGACFAALLGTEEHGRWLIAPTSQDVQVSRAYRDRTLVLETTYRTPEGEVALIDFMPPRGQHIDLVRIVQGRAGRVSMQMDLAVRFDYGSVVPWVRRRDGALSAVAGPDSLYLFTDVETRGREFHTVAQFTVAEGERVPFLLMWHPSHRPAPAPIDPEKALKNTVSWWERWSAQCTYEGEWAGPVIRSLITLKALTYAPTGAIVAAPTTSLPESIGGPRNWDYRITWLRDATFTLYALLISGFEDEARRWREWLLRAVAGEPSQLQIMYGLAGERRVPELELPWLPGYEDSRPVRIGNAAVDQFQLDVYGELMDALHQSRRAGLRTDESMWSMQLAVMEFLESAWADPDEGIWEVRGPRRHFTHSKVMAWVGVDRAIKAVERFGLDGPVDRWKALKARIHDEVCREGFDAELGSFVQFYGSKELDASLLRIPLVGFLGVNDERVRGTVSAIERGLMEDGYVRRYRPDPEIDGLPADEGAFLACSFWLADNLALMGREDEAREVFERLLGLCNDVGLLSEECDPSSGRLLGNFPQAFSHISVINTAHNLSDLEGGPAHRRPEA